MRSSRRIRMAWRASAVAATATMIFIGGHGPAGAADRPPADDAPGSMSMTVAVEGQVVRTPPPPQHLTSSGLRPLERGEVDRLRGGGVSRAVSCDIDFDNDAAMALIPNGAIDTFAYSPWWNQMCSGHYVRVYPTDTDHLHVGYVDTTIGPCLDSNNPYDTPGGLFSRGDDCEPIDPVTEPRSSITVGHFAKLHGRLDVIDSYGSDSRRGHSPSSACASSRRLPRCATACLLKARGSPPHPSARSMSRGWSTAGRAWGQGCGTSPTGPRAQSAWISSGAATHSPATTTSGSADRPCRPSDRGTVRDGGVPAVVVALTDVGHAVAADEPSSLDHGERRIVGMVHAMEEHRRGQPTHRRLVDGDRGQARRTSGPPRCRRSR